MDFSTNRASGKSDMKRLKDAIEHSGCGCCCGSIYIDDDSDHTAPTDGHFTSIFATAAAVLDASSMPNTDIEDIADLNIPVGSTIYGRFPTISLVSGKVIACKSYHWATTS